MIGDRYMNIFESDGAKLFVKALLSLETEEECRLFIEDIMTTKEILDMSQRMLVAKLLDEGLVYSKIMQLSGASNTTISRVNRCYAYGGGGYKTVLGRIEGAEN
mgnify:FL=1